MKIQDSAIPLEIIIDHREKQCELPSRLSRFPEIKLTYEQLAIGDYIINEYICVERKTAMDFIVSIIDGRLFIQAKNLKTSSIRALLILEGDLYSTESQMHHHAIIGALLTLAVSWNIPVIHSRDTEETASILKMLANQTLSVDQPQLARKGYKPKRIMGKKNYFLQGLPGVGPKSAKSLISRFDSLYDIICADENTLGEVPGIGKKKAVNIYSFLRH